MQYRLESFSESHRGRALHELARELAEFSHDGITQLAHDLQRDAVLRGSWSGCVISYKRGAPGSCRRDRHGRARNPFTVLWDNGWISRDEVLAALDAELARRAALPRRPAPAVAG